MEFRRIGRGAMAVHTEIRLFPCHWLPQLQPPSQQDWPSCSFPRPGILPACDKMLLSILQNSTGISLPSSSQRNAAE